MKILTLNIGFYGDKHGVWDARKSLIAEVINKHQPDVVALQAVASDESIANGATAAQQLLEICAGYLAHVEKINDTQHIAFLSKLPFAETNALKLTRRENGEDTFDRVLLHGAFDTEFGRLNLFNAHFSWVDQQAQNNVNEALEFADQFAGEKMLVGDLNQEPDRRAMRTFVENGWTDAFAKLSDESGFTFEAPDPTIRIDYVWAHGALADNLQSMILVKNSKDEARLSDHYGLLVTVFENPRDKPAT